MKILFTAVFILFVGVSVASAQNASTPWACPVVTSFMKIGSANRMSDVLKLQAFLKVQENLDVEVSGIFDQKTEAAVMAFQRKYMSETMAPWGATIPSGVVHITTAKKINQIACGTSLTLDGTELSALTAYRNAASAAALQTAATGTEVADQLEALDSEVDLVATDATSNTAAVGHISVMSRFRSFLAGLFK